MNHIELYSLRPVNRTAAVVVQQSGMTDTALRFDELVSLKERLERKHRLIKRILGVRTKTHHKNIKYRLKRGHLNPDNYSEPRLLPEYMRIGSAIQLITRELESIRKLKQKGNL